MKSMILVSGAAALLVGCAHTADPEPQIITREVLIDKPVPCTPENLGPPPAYPDTDQAIAAARTPEERYAMVIAGRLLRIARLAAVEPVIEVCREPKL